VTITSEVPVLIVGGGPVGLTASVLLSRFGVASLLVERHRGTSLFPKGRGITTRAMEVFRQMGLEDDVLRVGLPREDSLHVFFAETLTSPRFRRGPWGEQGPSAVSPTHTFVCSQDRLEPVLRARAEALRPEGVRFGCEMTTFSQDESGVTAEVVERDSGRQITVRASYVVAADGARSTVRRQLGVGMIGPEALSHQVSILFEAGLGPHVADRRSVLYNVANAYVRGIFLTVDNADRWLFTTAYDPTRGEAPGDFTEERCVEIVRRAAGLPDLGVRYVGLSTWEPAAQVAERFREGRIFFAGDAAHLTTPFGGFGMSCGIQDAHNLAWKLAGVLQGWAGEGLLASYEPERRPASRWTVDESLRNMQIAKEAERDPEAQQRLLRRRTDAGLVLGCAYESSAVVPDWTAPPAAADPYAEYVPTARPGHRAPHVALERRGEALSTLDLFGCRLVLLAGEAGQVWCAAGRRRAEMGVPIEAYRIGGADADVTSRGDWREAYGIEEGGAVLVRPDGHVAWRRRGSSTDPESDLGQALRRILGRASD
jgi:2-polyprenyl-6-methoxyphenol hydroxylase-like FAD-dependent oxidoreductase